MPGHILELGIPIGVIAGRPLDRGCLGRMHCGCQHGGGVGRNRHRALGHAGGDNGHEHQKVAGERFHVLINGVDPSNGGHCHAAGGQRGEL